MGFDLSAKRELNNGFGNALNSAVELAVTPALLALIGWQIDRWLGTTPLFLLLLFAFTMGYVAWKQFAAYDTTMRRQERELLGRENDRRAR
jgi:F0F1-type ATP synthase assembly protein I